MSAIEQAVRDAQASLHTAIKAARAAGYRVRWQGHGGDYSPVIDGGPEREALKAVAPAVPVEEPQAEAPSTADDETGEPSADLDAAEHLPFRRSRKFSES